MVTAMSPGNARRSVPAELQGRYNGAGLQRDRILDCLRQAGAAGVPGPELARVCNVPSLTKRISELRLRYLWPIDSYPHLVVAADGTVNTFARYVLSKAQPPQLDLFDPNALT